MSREGWLSSLVARVVRHPGLVLAIWALLAAASLALTLTRLGVTTDTNTLFSPKLAWKQQDKALNTAFPQFANLIVAVVDGRTSEQVDAVAAALTRAANADHTNFKSASNPAALPYYRKNGLLFLDRKTLEALLDQITDAQPFIGQLAADPTARGLLSALSLIGVGVQQGQVDLSAYNNSLVAFHQALSAELAGRHQPLSWRRLLTGSLSDLGGSFRFVLVHPRLNYGALEPGGKSVAALRALAAALPDVKSGAVRVRITGDVQLSDEEFASVAEGVVWGLLASFVLVTVWLAVAVKSLRLIWPILTTLIAGLLLTTGFAALAVGTLNLISIAFAILFVGIAVDFAIQFSVRFREAKHEGLADGAATIATARRSGVQILVAALATAAGFLSFVPTDFAGVAQLGLVAGVGMLIAFAATLTLLPALLMVARAKGEAAEIGFAWAKPFDALLVRRRRGVLALFLGLAVAGAIAAPRISFDSDPLHTKNPNTEAMRTLADMMQNPTTNPYTIAIMTPADQTEALAARLRKLPDVAQVLTEASFVPKDQTEKLAMIADTTSILAPTLSPSSTPPAPVTAADIRLAVKAAASQLTKALPKLPENSPLVPITHDLQQLETAPDNVLMTMNADLTRFLPAELADLRDVLSAQPVTAKDLPPAITRDWVAANGLHRIEVVPTARADQGQGLRRFVAEVRAVAPNAGGSAVTIVASADTIIGAFRQAAVSAVIVIAVILLFTLRRIKDTALVLAPLLLSSIITVLLMLVAGLGLNFANIIALPLLLGVGVSFNIYFVMNWRAGLHNPLGSPTARAVMMSALTTGTAFGSLAASHHPGTASMGVLLLLSLGATLTVTLVFVPALLASVRK